jgi:hypothetical protein
MIACATMRSRCRAVKTLAMTVAPPHHLVGPNDKRQR